MKQCPYCGKEYSDEYFVCALDETSLESSDSTPSRPHQTLRMKKSVKIFVILCILLLELVWAAWPRLVLHGAIYDESYRHDERFAALAASREHPSPEAKAALDREIAVLNRHIALRASCIFVGVLVIDALGIYFFWIYDPKKTTA